MKTVYINKETKRDFNKFRNYLVKYFNMTSKQTRKVRANLKAHLTFFVVGGVTFEDREVFR